MDEVPITPPRGSPVANYSTNNDESRNVQRSTEHASGLVVSQHATPVNVANFSDPYPTLDYIGDGVYKLPGSKIPIFIAPKENYCSLDGLRIPSKWCPHLVSAALRENMSVPTSRIAHSSLSKLDRSQKVTKSKSGRKKYRNFDYKDLDFNQNSDEALPSKKVQNFKFL